jgi:hypothetical protein
MDDEYILRDEELYPVYHLHKLKNEQFSAYWSRYVFIPSPELLEEYNHAMRVFNSLQDKLQLLQDKLHADYLAAKKKID